MLTFGNWRLHCIIKPMWMKMIRISIIFLLIRLQTISTLTNDTKVEGNSTVVNLEKLKPQNLTKQLISNETHSKTTLSQSPGSYASLILARKYAKKCEEYTKCKNNSIPMGPIDVKKGVIIPKCGLKEFFISDISTMATADNHTEACCVLGLRPAQIDSKNDINCIKTFMDQTQAHPKGIVDTLDRMLLVAAQDANYSNAFTACPSLLPISNELWAPGEPNNLYGMESCVALSLKNDSSGFVDIYCNVAMRFLCQKKQIRKPKLEPDYSFLVKGQYNKKYISTCQMATFTSSVVVLYNSDGTVKFERGSDGILLPPCNNKQYFLSNAQKMTQGFDAAKKCIEIGAVFPEFNEYSQIVCVKKHFDKYSNKSQKGEFWVQGFDIYLNRSFYSCPNLKSMPDDAWTLGEPDNAKGMETCVVLQLSGNNFGLSDKFCLTSYSYICEFTIKTTILNNTATSTYSPLLNKTSPLLNKTSPLLNKTSPLLNKTNIKQNKPVLPVTQPITSTTQKNAEEEEEDSDK